MVTKITANYEGMRQLLQLPEMEAMCRERAELVRTEAIATAPVFETGPHPGRYKDGFQEVTSGTDNGAEKPRAYARVVNDAPEALSVEFGTANNDAHHTLRRALEVASGGTVKAVESKNTARNEIKPKRRRRKR